MKEINQNIPEGYPHQMLQPQQDSSQEFDVKRLLVRILGAWPIILSSIVVALSLAFLINRYSTRIYEVKAVIMVSSEQKGSMESLMSAVGYYNPRLEFENEVVVLGSRTMVRRTLANLPFEVSYTGEGRIKASEIYPHPGWQLVYDTNHVQALGDYQVEELEDGNFKIISPNNEESPVTLHHFKGEEVKLSASAYERKEQEVSSEEWFESPFFRVRITRAKGNEGKREGLINVNLRSKESLVESYFEKVKIEPTSEGSAAIDLSMQGAVPEKVKAYVDELIHQYQLFNLETKNKTTESALAFISRELDDLQDSLDQVEAILEKFQSENAAIDLSEKGTQLFEEIFSLEKELTILKSQDKYFEYLEDYIANRSTVESVVAPVAMGMENTGLEPLIELLNQLQAERSALLIGQKVDNPRIKGVDNRIRSAREALAENLSGISKGVKFQIKELTAKRNQLEAEIRTLPKTQMELINIRRKYGINENLFLFLMQKKAETAIILAGNTPDSQVIDPATIDKTPVSPNSKRTFAIALMLGLAIPIGIIFITDLMDNKIRNKEDVESITQMPIVAMIGHSDRNTNLVVAQYPKSSLAESFRALRSNISFLSQDKPIQTMLFTSSIGGEGKTFISINMASILAASGKKTVLVGLDLRKPKIYNDFNLSNEFGASTVLSGQMETKEAIQATKYANLSIISADP